MAAGVCVRERFDREKKNENKKKRLRSVEIAERKELYNSAELVASSAMVLYVLLVNQGKRVRRPSFSCFSSARSFRAEKLNFANGQDLSASTSTSLLDCHPLAQDSV